MSGVEHAREWPSPLEVADSLPPLPARGEPLRVGMRRVGDSTDDWEVYDPDSGKVMSRHRSKTEADIASLMYLAQLEARALRHDLDEAVAALRVVMGDIDFTKGACRMSDMVGACLSKEALAKAHAVIEQHRKP
jgi:hypothetical protein